MFLQYLKSRARVIAALLAFALIFALVFSLYDLPVEAVGYASLLCAALGAAVSAYGYARWRRRCLALERLTKAARLSCEALPEPRDGLEERYQELLRGLAEELSGLEARADAGRRAAADYYAMWAHQIKTPIAAMSLILQQSASPEKPALNAELFRIEQYVGMVLGYLKLEGDGNDFVLRRHSLDGIVRASVRKFTPLFILKKLPLDFAPTGLEVLTDAKWLGFTIEQLLSNALKYTSSGGIRIYAEGDALCVEDTGMGIAPEDLPRLGERGFTGYNGHEDKKSTGLGLYLCRQVCGKLGHTLDIESAPGVGTKVRIGFGRPEAIYE